MAEFIKCGNPNCINMIERVKKGGHWKKFCNSKCRSQFHSNTSSKYATPSMIGSSIGQTVSQTVTNQVNHAVGQLGATVTDQMIKQVQSNMQSLGLPIPKYTIGSVIVSQLAANLFGVKKMDTRITLAKWFGGLGAILDYTFRNKGQYYEQLPPEQIEQKQMDGITEKAKKGGFVDAASYRKITIPTIPMSPEYDYLFGMPSRDFYMVVHGLPGNGKTTFAVKFAQYFHKHHGRVLYLASEQNGVDLSFQSILKEQKATFQLHTQPQQLTEELLLTAFRSYDLIILDSATNLGFYPSQVKKLQEQSGKALISILQSTKDGNFKGSQEWLHDVDISIKIDDFNAHLEKTRYKTSSKKIPTKGTTIPI